MKEGSKELNNAVIEIEEVDFLITPGAAAKIEKGIEMITLHRLVDNKDIVFPIEVVRAVIKKGITDRL